jgi:hypothetical protein
MDEPGQAVTAGDMHREQVATGGSGGDPGSPADQRLTLGTAGERDDDSFLGLPGGGDTVLFAVFLQPLFHAVRQPQQRKLAQRSEIARTEVVRQGGIDLVRFVDVAVCHPSAQRLWCHVHQLDLFGGAHYRVRHGFALWHTGNRLHYIVERFEVLDVHRADHIDAGLEQHLDRLPPLVVPGDGDVGVRQLVHQCHLGFAGEHRDEVHLFELGAAVAELQPWQHRQLTDAFGGERPTVRFDERHHHVGAPCQPPVALVQHLVRLTDARRRTEVNPKLTARHLLLLAKASGTARRDRDLYCTSGRVVGTPRNLCRSKPPTIR